MKTAIEVEIAFPRHQISLIPGNLSESLGEECADPCSSSSSNDRPLIQISSSIPPMKIIRVDGIMHARVDHVLQLPAHQRGLCVA